MFNFIEVDLEQLAIHYVGNKTREESIIHSESPLNTEGEIRELLLNYFLTPFKKDIFFKFSHEINLEQNVIYSSVNQIFSNPETLFEESKKIAQHLYEQSIHPKVNGGEFYVTHFTNCIIDDEVVDVLGLFKSENKETYLKVYEKNKNWQIIQEDGLDIRKLDKGCLIFNTEKEKGYKVAIVDSFNKTKEARYWKDDFLKLEDRVHDSYHQTQGYMNLCKSFVDEVYNENNAVERPDQIELLNRSMEYFMDNDNFSEKDFEENVMADNQVADAFKDYKKHYKETNAVELDEDFNISQNAVKQEKKKFKSILKLDKNFHVYIHGDRSKIQKGFDQETGMHYYKIFYDTEY